MENPEKKTEYTIKEAWDIVRSDRTYMLLMFAVSLILVPLCTMLVTKVLPYSYMHVAIENMGIQIMIIGFMFLLLFITFANFTSDIPHRKLIRLSAVGFLIFFVFNSPFGSLPSLIKDVQAVKSGELHEVKGKVIGMSIDVKRSRSGKRDLGDRNSGLHKKGSTYYQNVIFNNENQDRFKVRISQKTNLAFEIEQYYHVIALPHSNDVVDIRLLTEEEIAMLGKGGL